MNCTGCKNQGTQFHLSTWWCDECVLAMKKPVALAEVKETEDQESVRRHLQEMLERADHLSGVVIIGHIKGGGEYLRVSKMSKPEKAACFALMQSYICDLFRCDPE